MGMMKFRGGDGVVKPILVSGKTTDIVVIVKDGEKEATVILMKKRRAVSITARIWTESQWDEYINRRMNSHQRTSMRLQENEK